MDLHDREWGRKGATLSDKTARQEYGLTQDEIFAAIDAGKLQYRPAAMHGNPWLRLLRREVEDLARTLHGERYLREQQARTELARINRELKQLLLSSPPSRNGGPRSFPSSASKARHGNDLPIPTAIRVSALLVPFPLGALVRQRRQRELQRLHLLVHHACEVILSRPKIAIWLVTCKSPPGVRRRVRIR